MASRTAPATPEKNEAAEQSARKSETVHNSAESEKAARANSLGNSAVHHLETGEAVASKTAATRNNEAAHQQQFVAQTAAAQSAANQQSAMQKLAAASRATLLSGIAKARELAVQLGLLQPQSNPHPPDGGDADAGATVP